MSMHMLPPYITTTNLRRRKRKKSKTGIVYEKYVPIGTSVHKIPDYETNCPTKDIPSRDDRMLGPVPKKKVYESDHTIAPAYNKGPYQVISKNNIKDIGK